MQNEESLASLVSLEFIELDLIFLFYWILFDWVWGNGYIYATQDLPDNW